MSLINKVLRDLDARSTTRGPAKSKAVHQGLRPITPSLDRKYSAWQIPVLIVVVSVAVYVGVSATLVPLPYSRHALAAIGLKAKTEAVKVAATPVAKIASSDAPATGKSVDAAKVKKSGVDKSEQNAVASKLTIRKQSAVKRKPVAKRKKKVIVAATDKGELKKRVKPISALEKAENAFREGAAALERGNQALAERKLRLTLKHNPRYAHAYELLAGVLISSDRSEDGQRVLAESLTQLPGHAQLSNLLARLYVDQGREAEAIRILEQAQKKNTLNAKLMSFRAVMYQRDGRHADAVRAYREALTVTPSEGKWWVGLAISLEAQRDWSGARSAYEKAQTANLSPQLARYTQQRLNAVNVSQ